MQKTFVIACFCMEALLSGALVQAQQDLLDLDRKFQTARETGKLQDAQQIAARLVDVARAAKARNPQNAAAVLHNVGSLYDDFGRYDEAETLLTEALSLYERALGPEHLDVAMTLNTLGAVKLHKGQYAQSESLLKKALAIQERKAGTQSADVAYTLNNLALLAATQGDFRQAEPLYERALKIKRALHRGEHLDVAAALNNLASAYEATGRLSEAEQLLRQSLAQRIKLLPESHPQVAASHGNLGLILVKQGKLGDAEPLLKRAIFLRQEAGQGNDPQIAFDLSYLGALYRAQTRYADAERVYRRALRVRRENLPADHLLVLESQIDLASLLHQEGLLAESAELYAQLVPKQTLPPDRRLKLLYNAGMLYEQQKDYAAAAAAYDQSLALLDELYGPSHPERSKIMGGLARLARQAGKGQEALDSLNAAIEISDRSAVSPRERFLLYQERARLQFDQGNKTEAIGDMTTALRLAERQRLLAAGGDADRAQTFAEFAQAFDLLISWHAAAGAISEAIVTADELRARSLADQLQAQLQGVDLLEGLPAGEADRLRRRLSDAQVRLASLERQLEQINARQSLSADDRIKRVELDGELGQARDALVEIHGEIRNVSPAYRRAAGDPRQRLSTADMQAWIDREQVLVLAYHFGQEGGHVAILAPGATPRILPLAIEASLAEKVHTTPGPLNLERLQKLMLVGSHSLPHLVSREEISIEVEQRLAELGELLIPAEARGALAAKYRWCCVVPSGPLNRLPLECLIVERSGEPRYVLDACPPIAYAPSLQILLQLAQRESPAPQAGLAPVLTVGNPSYSAGDATAPGPAGPFARAGGKLSPLPYSGIESTWVADVFGKSGSQSVRLTANTATEAQVRQQMPGRRVVHFACHGAADDAYGNHFGALALAPGTGKLAADDGFLTLPEIYQLDARHCELVILSACRTNYGPEQRGEGTWTLSRGFLVAGSRRVVASNWLVDDEAAASLISYYCSNVANSDKTGSHAYAQHLQAAKRWVRQQEKWSSPFYWGTFVLIGPN